MGVYVCVNVCGVCGVICERCVCVQENHQQPPHSGSLLFHFFLPYLYFCPDPSCGLTA